MNETNIIEKNETTGTVTNDIVVKFMKTCAVETWRKKTEGAGAYDIYNPADVIIQPGAVEKINTCMRLEIPRGYEIEISARSSISMKKIIITGKIDSDYRGEVFLIVMNLNNEKIRFMAGDRIAQATLRKTENMTFIQAGALSVTDRGAGGFGSTGA